MNLDSVGLELEADIFNEQSDIRAFVATNLSGQVDGESDSIVVIAFRYVTRIRLSGMLFPLLSQQVSFNTHYPPPFIN